MADLVCLAQPERDKAVKRVGRAGILVVESIQEAAAALEPLRGELADAVGKAKTPKAAQKNVDDVIAKHADDGAIGDALFVPMLMAEMAGQLMVRGHEANQVELVGGAQAPDAFLNLPWEEAIEEFKARGVVKDDELSTLIKSYDFRSKEARTLMLRQLQERTRANLVKALEEGQSLQGFSESMRDTGAGLGITVDDPAYLETVFRTNVQSAYGAGRYRAMEDPDIIEARPYVQYRTVGDARVRDAHAELDRKVFEIGTPEWKRIAPPNGYNCRCSAVSISPEELKDMGISVSRNVPKGGEPAEGFDGPPVANIEQEIT